MCVSASVVSAASVEMVGLPEGASQPRAVADASDAIHVVYFQSKDAGGNLVYANRAVNATEWSSTLTVSTPEQGFTRGSSIGAPNIALSNAGRIHVTWFDMRAEKFWYARLNDDGTAFEPQRNLVVENHRGVESSAALAVHGDNAYMVWHAGNLQDESERGIYMRVSEDAGKTFGPETRIDENREGACGCCGIGAGIDTKGVLHVSYRAAGNSVHRDMTLLRVNQDNGEVSHEKIDTWELASCPVTVTTVVSSSTGTPIVAWENKERTYLARTDALSSPISVGAPPAAGRQKNPAVAIADDGAVLVVWGEGPGWGMGGRLHWRVFSDELTPTDLEGQGQGTMRRDTTAAVVALSGGRFAIIL